MDDLISRRAAIDALGEKPVAWSKGEYERGLQNQWGYDVSAIKQLPPALPEPMKIDLSRCSEENWERIKKEWANTPITAITAEPERIKGHWVRNGWAITCSECGYDMPYTVRRFCPNCGADMRGEQDE